VAVDGKELCCASACLDAVVAKEHKDHRGVALSSARVDHSRAPESQVARRGRPVWGRKSGGDDGENGQHVPRALRTLADFYALALMEATSSRTRTN
jgi:hypothetical protein